MLVLFFVELEILHRLLHLPQVEVLHRLLHLAECVVELGGTDLFNHTLQLLELFRGLGARQVVLLHLTGHLLDLLRKVAYALVD